MASSVQNLRKDLSPDELQTILVIKDLQLRSLLTITQAINDNVSVSGLYNMYKDFISWEMGVEQMALLSEVNNTWECVSSISYKPENIDNSLIDFLKSKRSLYAIKDDDPLNVQMFNLIVPVYHKEEAIAFALIGDFKDDYEVHTKIQFIRTITNIVAVAIENKKLFNIRLDQERFKKDMELASEVQKWLLPQNLPCLDECSFAHLYKPHYKVGGDYFDYIPYDDNSFFLCIGDISGKGVSAALLMSNLQALLKSLIKSNTDLNSVVRKLNKEIVGITNGDKFITFFISYIDLETNTISYINAGHNPPCLYSEGSMHRLDKGCTVLGAVDDLDDIEINRISYTADSVLLMFTDGLIDIRDVEGNYFDVSKVQEFIKDNCQNSINSLMNKLTEKIDDFKATDDYPDDVAVLGVKFANC